MVKILDLKFLGKPNTIASFLIESSAGPILIETGPYTTFKNLEKALAQHGYSAKDVKHVFVTHVHFDHAGAAWAFAELGALIYVHPVGAKHLINPTKLYESARRIYGDQMETLWGEMRPIDENKVVPLVHKERIKIGKVKLRAFHTPGHASHHLSIMYGKELFAGDVAGIKIGEGMGVPPCPPPDINIEAWKTSIKMILDMRFEALYLTHFGRLSSPKQHLIEVRARLVNWANFLRPLLSLGLSQDELVAKFEDYIFAQYEASGMKKKDIELYENANPAWMSVAGLTRYWNMKK